MPHKKLIIQIPCYNEEESLPETLKALPRSVEGIDKIEIMVINDGSSDGTVEVARAHGVDHVLDFKTNKGLAHVFMAGLVRAAALGADYVVNLDADNQYNADDIPKLLAPLMSGEADMVVGERPIEEIGHFSWTKKKLQRFGSWMVRKLSRTDVKDTASGYRALNRRAMLRLFIFNQYTYTHESLIAAADSGLRVMGVPIRVNEGVLRPSRLMRSAFQYVVKSGGTVLRFYMLYNPYSLFMSFFAITGLFGLLFVARFGYFYLAGRGEGWVQSLIIASILLTASLVSLMVGILSDIMRVNRKLLLKVLVEQREAMYEKANDKEEPTGAKDGKR